MRILVHACCGPCSTFVLRSLAEAGHQTEAFFFNPNIAPEEEFQKRAGTLASYCSSLSIPYSVERYLPLDFAAAVSQQPTRPSRCAQCYRLRLEKTAQTAASRGFDAFTTTLLISPYQDHEALRSAGRLAADAAGVVFHYEDFRPGYSSSRAMAKAASLYMQKYCGCALSLAERQLTSGGQRR